MSELFSERYGYKIKNLQVDTIDQGLRNRLWNAIYKYYFQYLEREGYYILNLPLKLYNFFESLIDVFLKEPMDEFLSLPVSIVSKDIKNFITLKSKWFEVYDLLEFLVQKFPDRDLNEEFKIHVNKILEEEKSAYRFVGDKIVPMTRKEEISEIEKALDKTSKDPLKPIHIHLDQALTFLADKQNPDYRNSIKEAISAIEATCKLIAKDDKATLAKALKRIEKEGKLQLHPALKEAFQKLYGYASDADGIRHALLDEPNLNFEDAKFMLVASSAFINYLLSKATKKGII